MNGKTSRTVASMTRSMFAIAAGAGMVLGMLAVLWMFWPIRENGYGGSLGDLGLPLAYGAVAGVLMGLVCCSGAYAAIEIQAMGNQPATAARQSAAAGIGAVLAALLPALAIAALGLGEIDPAPFLGTALGFLAVCFASGFAILAGLNRCAARG
ncbi:hypothetical protein ACIOTN_14920 [Glutamicibacter sp. NPDC087661]|uniref:hypothetical protein n=1 Tax=Glutamicibacter sp. NPDC087661 TaxID=3363996 RepID=UPI00382F04BB